MNVARLLALNTSFAVAILFSPGCKSFGNSPIPADLVKDGDCVAGQILAGVTDVAQVEAACLPGQLQSVADLIDYLLRGQFGKEHPALVPAMRSMKLDAARLRAQSSREVASCDPDDENCAVAIHR